MPILPADASRRSRSVEDHSSPPTTRRDTRSPAPDGNAALQRRIDRQPASSDYAAFLAHVSNQARAAGVTVVASIAEPSRDAAVQTKLDGLRDAFSGPYRVGADLIAARPMFRMTTHVVPKKMALEVDALGARAGVRAPFEARVGQCKPRDLVAITQALIDAGRLPPAPDDLAMRIRQMQWAYGIGVDCAGYAKLALLACSARAPQVYGPGMESFRDLDRTRAGSFAKISVTDARPGDLVTLDGATDGDWGHNVVVYSHVIEGSRHVFEVDSSWGAGAEGAEVGGYRRDTWIYDAESRTWSSFEPGTTPPQRVDSAEGPAGDRLHGVYRPR